jgi:photosystem II stability/assembly factor-like uncharacterized protein
MKTSQILFSYSIFALSLLSFPTALGQWQWQNPLPQGNTLNDVFLIDQNHVWAVGDAGTILYSGDGGHSFEPMNYPSHANLSSVKFLNDDVGMIAGDSGIILKTINGGLDWERIETEYSATINDLCFTENGNAWFCGEDGTVMVSTDLGQSWQVKFNGPDMELRHLSFSDNLHGWFLGRCCNEFIRTSDGGNAWDTIEIPNVYQLFDVFFIDSLRGWVSMTDWDDDEQKIAETTDGGNSWEYGGDVFKSVNILSIYFTDEDHGWIAGSSNTVPQYWGIAYYTQDGGTTWNDIDFQGQDLWGEIRSIYFTDRWHGWLVGSSGMIACTSNGGQTWEVLCSSDYRSGILNDVLFMDDMNGWAVGGNFYPFKSHIFITEDGGDTWNDQGDIDFIPKRIFFINLTRGWMIGDPSLADASTAILRTIDGGNTWVTQYSQYYQDGTFSDIYFKNSMKGWAVGEGGYSYPPPDISLFYLTLDGGVNWIDQSYLFNKALSSICFSDDNHGWIAGYKTIMKTIDGGQTWSEAWTGPHFLKDIFFTDNDHGWAIGDSAAYLYYRDVIMRTTDGGTTWEQQFPGFGSSNKRIFFVDHENGWICRTDNDWDSREGDILYTVDGGVTWDHMYINFNWDLGGIYFSDIDHGWVVGQNDAIFHIDNGSIVNVKDASFNLQHPTFNISCQPNPTRGMVDFRLSMADGRWVKLEVFDVQGREVATVLDGRWSGGQVVRWDASDLPAGIYFYQLTTDDRRLTTTAGKILKN